MDSVSSMSREKKKNQLKRQIVPPRAPEPEEDGQEVVRKAHRRVVRKRLIILLVLLLMAGGAGLIFWQYDRYHQFSSYQVSWEHSLADESQEGALSSEGNFCGYVDFADGVLKYTKDGASYIDNQGDTIWVQSYEMNTPIVSVNGDYAVVADRQGTSMYICNTDGCQGQAAALLPILQVSVSAHGVVAALQEDSSASYIYFYRSDGSNLDLYIKSVLSGDGYPVDLSLSPAGTQVITSYMYLEQGMLKNRIVFYNFGLGKDDARRVVGGFQPQDLADAMAGRVRFLDESHAVIFTDKGLQFFSTRVETSPESVSQVLFDENVRSIAWSETYVGVVTDNAQGEDPYRLRIYQADGTPVFDRSFNFQYTGFDIDGDLVLLYNDTSCCVYNMAGTEKFNGTFDFPVSKVSEGRFPSTLLVMGAQSIKEIKLQ